MKLKQKLWYLLIALGTLSLEANAQLTYKDVAPIFIERCGDCHHKGKIFPDLTRYSSTSLYKGIISYNLQTGRMPPWPADTTYSRFTHERIIPLSEKTKILDWLAAGAARGDTTQAAVAPAYTAHQLSGTPDLVLRIPKYISTANYADKNICFSIPTGLTQNRVLRAYEIVSGNAHLAHHIMVNVDTLGTATSDFSGACSVSSYGIILGGWAPGSMPVVFPRKDSVKFGVAIKSGSNLVLQVHYPAGTAGQIDSTEVRLYFHPVNTPGIRFLSTATVKNTNFSIAPDTVVAVTGVFPRTGVVPGNISVFSIFPHSHKICTSTENYAMNGTSAIPLCRIRRWNFNWQGFYTFQKLMKVSSGYRLYGKHVFDNTASNPNHSQLPVVAGPGTGDEMLYDVVLWTPYQAGDENIDIKSIIESDSLFIFPKEMPALPVKPMAGVYPNPFKDQVTINVLLTSDEPYLNISIYNSIGQKIRELASGAEPAGLRTYVWDGRSDPGGRASPGVYLYKIRTGSMEQCGKIMLSPAD